MTKTKTPSRRTGMKSRPADATNDSQNERIETPLTEDAADAGQKEPASFKPVSPKNELGRLLKAARLEKGLSLREVSTKLCIRQPYLSAIEEGRYQDLPWAAYTSGFVRSYAGLVGLDQIDVMKKYGDEIAVHEKRPVLIMPETKQKLFLPKTAFVLFACVCALGVYLIWHSLFSSSDPVQISSVSPVLMATDLDSAEKTETADLDDDRRDDALPDIFVADARTPEKETVPVPAQAAAPAVKPSRPLIQTQALAKPDQPPTVYDADDNALPENEHAVENSRFKTAQSYGVQPSDSRVTIEASEDSWVEVTSEEGIHFSRVMQVGDRFYVKGDGKGYFLSTGNAKVLLLYVDGKRITSPSGTIRRNISLAADDLLKK